MAAPIQKLAKLASKTFARCNISEGQFLERLAQLRSSFNEITATDVNFDPNLVKEKYKTLQESAPVSYVHLWEDDVFSMGIFVVRKGGRLPLHDHPDMYGLLKVIHGTLRLVSFSEINGLSVPDDIGQRLQKGQVPLIKSVILEHEGSITDENESYQLTPTHGNFHEITAVTDLAAFVDILAPPYDRSSNRDCHYFTEIPNANSRTSKGVRWIIPVPQPLDFWCDAIDYTGPALELQNSSS